MTFDQFFHKATGHRPYPYQARLAESVNLYNLLKIPTGAGKTEAAILGWLYRKFHHPDHDVRDETPSRLVYCLPMRTLVEQTEKRVQGWLENLGMADKVGVVVLMGGEPRTQWYLEPEKPTIVIGTQDMLLSRTLNRGYGNSPFMWPVEYGLLNNDCLWVMDEVQLMANGLPTSTQLAGLRRKFKTFGPSQSLWMSATAKSQWLETIDHPAPTEAEVMELGDADMADSNLAKRHNARKLVSEVSVRSGGNYKGDMAKLIADNHKSGTLTLAIVNTVERAQDVYKALRNSRQIKLGADTMLIHSRFRGEDRERQREWLGEEVDESGAGRIVVATQAVEAGVDISARTLITELAPWPSMVQRFGRCNRAREYDQGEIFWIDMGERKQDTAPYEPEEVEDARGLMKSLEGESAGPSDIERLGDAMSDTDHLTVIRRRDVEGLFDTTPDLSGGYLDVSQYVRGIDERNVSVFWRDVSKDGIGKDVVKPAHSEIVNVPLDTKGVHDYLNLRGANRKAWRWDFLDGQWVEIWANEIHPGMRLMLDAAQGGYSSETGWNVSNLETVDVVKDRGGESEDGQGLDPNSISQGRWVTLSEHSRHVEREVDKVLEAASDWIDDPDIRKAVKVAALHHDVGKAHCVFQQALRKEGDNLPEEGVLLAKSKGNGRPTRRHFRHELGSALAVLEHADGLESRYRDLAAYLAAAHHGKIRLGIRSLPGRRRDGYKDSNPDAGYLLGYKTDDTERLPSVDLGEGVSIGETALDMSIAQIGLDGEGRRSWLERSLGLLEWLGPFRLAYLEAIVRAADMRASRAEVRNDESPSVPSLSEDTETTDREANPQQLSLI